MPRENAATPALPRPEAGEAYAPPREAGAVESPAVEDARRGTPWTLTTYFAEGLPYSIVHQVSAEYFTAFGASLAAIGYTSFYGLAWNLKFIWSPLVDRYGTLRRWILATEVLLAVVLAAIALRANQGDLPFVAIALVLVSLLGATQDIAIDGYYIGALDKPAQASLSGTRVGAYRVALLVGKSGLVALAGFTRLREWSVRYWSLSFATAAALLFGLAIAHRALLRPLRGAEQTAPPPERATARTVELRRASSGAGPPAGANGPRPAGGGTSRGAIDAARAFVESFDSFRKKPRFLATVGFIVAFKAGDALLFNMSVPFLRSLGLDTDMRGLLSTPSIVASVVGTIVGGVWIRRASLARTLVPIAFLQAIAIPIYTAVAIARPSFGVIAAAVSIEQLIAGIGNAALLVFLMRRAEGPHKTAHFAMGTALMSVPTTAVGLFAGDLAEALGFARFFLLAFIVAVPGVVLARHVPKD